ncbi:3D domain-containing protein [Gallibacter intestinalis]|uniref:3D domain-containing protein n=1 Tax=Gallibacter intestinalis TaxID=2779356 RepID=A0ABR9QXT5_9FIRM|nr:3D domain-containing protein [Gallibacter intestinalis]MBE5035684.1 hypothetical protein [Gallibacter intestinalis]
MQRKVIAMAVILIVFIALGYGYYELQEVKAELQAINNNSVKAIEQLHEDIEAIKSEMDGIESNLPTFAGVFSTTAYCKCEKCCGVWTDSPTKSGTTPQEGRTIAVDPDVIPLGTQVIIDGKVYTAEDTGSAVKGNVIDIYYSDHEETEEYGRQNREVWICA